MLVLPSAAKAALSGTPQPRTGTRPIRVKQALSARNSRSTQSSGMLGPLIVPILCGIVSVGLCARHERTVSFDADVHSCRPRNFSCSFEYHAVILIGVPEMEG